MLYVLKKKSTNVEYRTHMNEFEKVQYTKSEWFDDGKNMHILHDTYDVIFCFFFYTK